MSRHGAICSKFPIPAKNAPCLPDPERLARQRRHGSRTRKARLTFAGSVSGVVVRCSCDGKTTACGRTTTSDVFSTRSPTRRRVRGPCVKTVSGRLRPFNEEELRSTERSRFCLPHTYSSSTTFRTVLLIEAICRWGPIETVVDLLVFGCASTNELPYLDGIWVLWDPREVSGR